MKNAWRQVCLYALWISLTVLVSAAFCPFPILVTLGAGVAAAGSLFLYNRAT